MSRPSGASPWNSIFGPDRRSKYYILFFYSFESSLDKCYQMISLWSLSDSKSFHVARTLLSILAVLNNAVVWIDSTRPLISKSSSPSISPLMTVPSAPITIGITVTFMFDSFFSYLPKSWYLFLFLLSFIFTLSSTIRQVLFFLLIITRFGRLPEIITFVLYSRDTTIRIHIHAET